MSGTPDLKLRHDRTPEQTLAAISGFDGELLLDLDETLYLQNSTEDFIDVATPGSIAVVLLRLLEAVKPWRRRGGAATRDWWRIRLVMLLFPWALPRWRRKVAALAADHGNAPLIAALRASKARPIIVTAGFAPIVEPLIAALGFGTSPIVAASAVSPDDRLRGKLAMAVETLGDDRVHASMVVTDSLDDLPLLDHCAVPARTLWPDARYHHAFRRVYLPGRYLTEVKRPGERYIVRGILQEDFAFWVLATIAAAAMPLLHVLGLSFLLVSFWAIYERGYVDNDRAARNFEKEPRLSATFGRVEVATPAIAPWLWAAASGAIAIVLLRWPQTPVPRDFIAWTLALATTYGLFKIYNRLDKRTRIWLFPGLQAARTVSLVALVPIGVAASLALSAHVIARWVPYYLYRIGGKDWPDAPIFLSRLMFYVLLWAMMMLTQGHESLLTPTALALLVWNIVRARKDLASLFRDAKRIDRRPDR